VHINLLACNNKEHTKQVAVGGNRLVPGDKRTTETNATLCCWLTIIKFAGASQLLVVDCVSSEGSWRWAIIIWSCGKYSTNCFRLFGVLWAFRESQTKIL